MKFTQEIASVGHFLIGSCEELSLIAIFVQVVSYQSSAVPYLVWETPLLSLDI